MSEILPSSKAGDPTIGGCERAWKDAVNSIAPPGRAEVCELAEWERYGIKAVMDYCRRSPPSVPPSVTVEEPTIEECESLFAEESGITIGLKGDVQDGWGNARDGIRAVRALCLSRTEKARESIDVRRFVHDLFEHGGSLDSELFDKWCDDVALALGAQGISTVSRFAVSPPARETRPTT